MAQDQMNITELLRRAIQQEITVIIDEEIREFNRILERKIKERTAHIAARAFENFRLDFHGNQVTLTVDFTRRENKLPER